MASVLTNLLGTVHPDVAQGEDTTLLRLLLDEMATQLETALSDDPLVEFELRKTLGVTFNAIAEYPSAEPHLLRALEIARGSDRAAPWGEQHCEQ